MFGIKNKIKAKEVKPPNYEVGLRFTYETTDFEEAIQAVEFNFDIEPSDRWEEVKSSKDMKTLHYYLTEEMGYDVKKYNLVNLNGGEKNAE